ncbi:ABC transporter permease [Streptococcus panodentis]|uniref:Multidrug ABC transporter permease n=1 Tax=Streptococcus panodentis TaxID=1581472 RepID=A0ABS5AW35_9STRE|nr:ABC transporter permease [Streptococcus panodentis]MBP2620789.1 multidrug ABC transporter permease [Streptococcus panodentis]
MKEVFIKRRQEFRGQCLKYLRYVFNDHFVLFLLIFIAFLAIQYSQLLRHFPENHLPIILSLVLLSLFILPFGSVATYLERPDALFLLVKEAEVGRFIREQVRRSYLLYAVLQTGILLLLAPLFLALGLPVWAFALYCLLMLLAKWLLFQRKGGRFFSSERLDWQAAIAYEERRKQVLLRFFALFTNVKGISNSVKRRAYLDGLTKLLSKEPGQTWSNLYLRSYLRNGDLFALTLRLLFLALLSILFVSQTWIAAAFVLLLNYLLLFQLTALYEAFDYQLLTQLFPLEAGAKMKGARQIIRAVGCCVLSAEILLASVFFQDKLAVLAVLAVTLLFYLFYLPFKLRRLVD